MAIRVSAVNQNCKGTYDVMLGSVSGSGVVFNSVVGSGVVFNSVVGSLVRHNGQVLLILVHVFKQVG